MKSSMNCRLYVPSRFTPGSQSPPVWPVSVPEPTYPVFTGPATFKLPAHPPPPTPCVRPFHAPWMPPVPPSKELRGRPTRMLMFCSVDLPYSKSTWQYDSLLLGGPLGGIISLLTFLITGLPASLSAGSAASWLLSRYVVQMLMRLLFRRLDGRSHAERGRQRDQEPKDRYDQLHMVGLDRLAWFQSL